MKGKRLIFWALLLATLMAPGWVAAAKTETPITTANDALLEHYIPISSLYLSTSGYMDPWSEQRWLGFNPILKLHRPPVLRGVGNRRLADWSLPEDYRTEELNDDADAFSSEMYYQPIDPYESRFKWKQSLSRSVNFSLAMSVVKRPATSSSGKSSGQPKLSASSVNYQDQNSDGLTASNEIDLWSVGVGVDWLVYNRHGVHLGYVYGGDGESALGPDLAGRPIENKQAVDLGYIVDLHQLNFRLGYIYSFSGKDETSQISSSSVDRDSTFYLKFQLQF